MDRVSFTFTRPVTSPPYQAGAAGETKTLTRRDAEHLQTLGYGTIVEESTHDDATTTDRDSREHSEPEEPAADRSV